MGEAQEDGDEMASNPRRFGRPTLRETLLKNKAILDFRAAAADKPSPFNYEIPPPPKARAIRRPVDGKPVIPLEKEVLASVLQALRNDPRIWIVDRRQSGVFVEGDRYIRVGQAGHLDISGMLKGGRYYEIECKRPGQKPDPRQEERIETVKRGGGVSGYCWSIESALALLP